MHALIFNKLHHSLPGLVKNTDALSERQNCSKIPEKISTYKKVLELRKSPVLSGGIFLCAQDENFAKESEIAVLLKDEKTAKN